MSFIVRGALSSLCFISLWACAHFSSNEEVLERSKIQAPAWVDQKPMIVVQRDKVFTVMELTPEQLDLPLGLKRAQDQMLQSAPKYMREIIAQNFKILVTKDCGQSVGALIADLTKREFKIVDFYFERLRRETPAQSETVEYFKIYTYANISVAAVNSAAQKLPKRCL